MGGNWFATSLEEIIQKEKTTQTILFVWFLMKNLIYLEG
jgi:hypothetical protein